MPPAPKLSVRIKLTLPTREGTAGTGFSLDVAFEASSGTTILFGPSGGGKSTTLAAIAGLTRPGAGRIALGEEVWFDSDRGVDLAPDRRRVAFVFQTLALFPHLTAERNVMFGMDRSLSREEGRARAAAILARLKVGHLAARRPATFSGGEAQRVAVARAFAMSPRLALFDEPFSAMDRKLRGDLVADLRGFVADLGIPLVHVTHQRDEALDLGDRVIVLDAGRVVRDGPSAEVLAGSEAPPAQSAGT